MRPKTIGLIAHTGKAGAAELIRAVCAEFARFSVPVLVEDATAALAQNAGWPRDSRAGPRSRSAGRARRRRHHPQRRRPSSGDDIKPIFGINIGSLGFLTCVASTDYREAVACIAAGKIEFSERALLDVELDPHGPGDASDSCVA